MKFFRRKRKVDLKQKEAELLEQIRNSKLSQEELLGEYELPPTFIRLQKLQKSGQIATHSIGFELCLDRPITPAPKDLIPFAITGGDGCYFAFITDFGNQKDLENCPIAFISPTDFDDTKPKQSNFLFAKNLIGFLSIMASIEYAEHIRFQNIYESTINKVLKDFILEFRKEQTAEEINRSDKTKERLIKEFEIEIVDDYYKYFKSVKEVRMSANHLQTIDGINLYLDSKTEIVDIAGETIIDYVQIFKEKSRASVLLAIRNAPYRFSYSNSDYDKYKVRLIDIFKNLHLEREKCIQEFEIEMDNLSGKWMKIRKQILKDER
jgi:hypothetical protein